jgi:MinD-like ATPase involved in chromosome partitioning or flagellar assembly
LAANLAVQVAHQGQRVGIVDTELHSPGIHTLFGLDSDHLDRVLNYYLWGDIALEEATYNLSPLLKIGEGEVALIGGGVYLTPSSIKVNDIVPLLRQGYDLQGLTQGFIDLTHRLKLDTLLIDTHPGLGEEALLSLAVSDVLVLVLCLDNQDFQGIAVTIDLARKLGVPQIFLVVNQVLPHFSFSEICQEMKRTYGEVVIGVLPFTNEMVMMASQNVFCLRYPEHPWTQGMQAIAQQLIHFDPETQNSWSESSTSPLLEHPLPIGLNMLDVLALPVAQRQVVRWLLRKGSITVAEASTYTRQEAESVGLMLNDLEEQGFVQKIDLAGETRYRLCLATRLNASSSASWKTLGDLTNG